MSRPTLTTKLQAASEVPVVVPEAAQAPSERVERSPGTSGVSSAESEVIPSKDLKEPVAGEKTPPAPSADPQAVIEEVDLAAKDLADLKESARKMLKGFGTTHDIGRLAALGLKHMVELYGDCEEVAEPGPANADVTAQAGS